MPILREEITPGLIQGIVEDGRRQRAAFHRQIEDIRNLRHLKQAVLIPKAYANTTIAVRSPIPWITAQYTTAALTRNFPIVNAEPTGLTTKDQRIATRKERWTDAVLLRLIKEAGDDVFMLAMDNAANDGLGVWKLIYAPGHWSNYAQALTDGFATITDVQDDGATFIRKETPKEAIGRVEQIKRRSKLPWIWRSVDPLTYFPFYDEDGIAIVAEVSRRSRLSMHGRFRDLPYSDDNPYGWWPFAELSRPTPEQVHSLSDEIEFVELWTRDWVAYLCDGYMRVLENQQKRPPYFEFGGLESADARPERRYMSSLYGMRDVAPALDSLLTMHHNLSYMQAYPKLVKERSPEAGLAGLPSVPVAEGDASNIMQLRWESGQILELDPGERLNYLVPPENPRLLTQIQIHNQLLREASPSEVFFGKTAGADEAGYAINQRLTQSKLPLNEIARKAGMALSQMVEHLWWSLENNVKEEIPVWGELPDSRASEKTRGIISLAPSDLNGFYSNTVELQPILPFERIQAGQFAAQMKAAGLMTKRQAMEEIGDRHPDETKDEQLIEAVEDSPYVQQALVEDVMRELGVQPPQQATSNASSAYQQNGASPAGLGGAGMPNEFAAPIRDQGGFGAGGRAAGQARLPNTPSEGI